MSFVPKRNLPRLDRHRYQAHSAIFWTLTLKNRSRGWLSTEFHHSFRDRMLHAAVRYDVWCPIYCLMPDHLHLLWMGMRRRSDQLNAMKFLRTELEPLLGGGREWQHQSYDHVLRDEERERDAFAQTCFYILANPVRAKLIDEKERWAFGGCVVPGYPRLDPWGAEFWPLFWKLHVIHREAEPRPSLIVPP